MQNTEGLASKLDSKPFQNNPFLKAAAESLRSKGLVGDAQTQPETETVIQATDPDLELPSYMPPPKSFISRFVKGGRK